MLALYLAPTRGWLLRVPQRSPHSTRRFTSTPVTYKREDLSTPTPGSESEPWSWVIQPPAVHTEKGDTSTTKRPHGEGRHFHYISYRSRPNGEGRHFHDKKYGHFLLSPTKKIYFRGSEKAPNFIPSEKKTSEMSCFCIRAFVAVLAGRRIKKGAV
jgi:hypothetical protein